jgi:transposase-like protein
MRFACTGGMDRGLSPAPPAAVLVNRTGVFRRLQLLRGWSNHEASPPYSPEVRARAVRMILDHQAEHTSQWSAIHSIADKIGCSGETLRLVRGARCAT